MAPFRVSVNDSCRRLVVIWRTVGLVSRLVLLYERSVELTKFRTGSEHKLLTVGSTGDPTGPVTGVPVTRSGLLDRV